MIIWGSKARTKTINTGHFYCPNCRQKRNYELKQAKRYFTLYFIPIFPMGDLGEFVECVTCKLTFKSDVLKLTPPKTQTNTADLLNAIKNNLASGQPVEYVTRDLVSAGIERALVNMIINNSIGEERKVCKACNLSYADTVTTCMECKQPLSEGKA